MNLDENLIIYAPLALLLVVVIWIVRVEVKLNRFLKGKDARTLEDTIRSIDEGLSQSQKFEKEMEEYLTSVEKRLRQSPQGIGVVRFNAFKGTGEGGNQSFAVTFANENGDGVVFSSIYSRDRVSVFSKPLSKWKSEYELSKEEKESLKKAKECM
ncbi:MAG: hypothetical protein COV70_01115 [Parcubacteria group bacterium CG11_big_fil_rev_8_21_14_0_20_39_22]|nr:MAG: hypothetical protein COV70_01115 [Parcubacteria group bacterium CG11_big_fil_rev_8_21_14_0_20_39_22]